MSELDDLRAQLRHLTAERNRRVEAANAEITRANRAYDRQAVPLARKIAALVPAKEPAKPARIREPRHADMSGTEEWSREEQEMYRQLTEGAK